MLARIGFTGTVIWGGGAALRMAFADKLGGFAWLWALITAPFVAMLVLGIRRSRRYVVSIRDSRWARRSSGIGTSTSVYKGRTRPPPPEPSPPPDGRGDDGKSKNDSAGQRSRSEPQDHSVDNR